MKLFVITICFWLQIFPDRGALSANFNTRGAGKRRCSPDLNAGLHRAWPPLNAIKFFSSKRASRNPNFVRNAAHESLVKVEPNRPISRPGNEVRFKSPREMATKIIRWFQFRKVPKEGTRFIASIVQLSLLGLVGYELILVLRDVYKEYSNDIRNSSFDEDEHLLAFPRKSVSKLISWLEKPEDERPELPPKIGPEWKIVLAQELHQCTELSNAEIKRILLQLTEDDAELLRSCLLPSNRKADFAEIGGFYEEKYAISQFLLTSSSERRKEFGSSSWHKMSDYEKNYLMSLREMSSKGSGRHMILWGPPGSGKSLFIRAIAKESGLPTLVVSPILIQNYWHLKELFSLVSTIGSCVLVFDDLDVLFPNHDNGHDRITAELMQWLDDVRSCSPTSGSNRCVYTIAATSRPWDVHISAWRRFPNRIYLRLPNSEDRYDMLTKFASDLPPIDESVLQHFASVTDGFIPLDLFQLLLHACQNGPLARNDATLTIDDVNMALSTFSPTIISAQYVQQLISYVSSIGSGLSTTQSHTQQPMSSSTVDEYLSPNIIQSFPCCENGYCFETVQGNFYQFQIPVDEKTLDAINTILLFCFEWNTSDDWDFSDEDDDSD